MFCSQCGQPLASESENCPQCGGRSSASLHSVSLKPESAPPHPISLRPETAPPKPLSLGPEAVQAPPVLLVPEVAPAQPVSPGPQSPIRTQSESSAEPVVLIPDPSPSPVTLMPDSEPAPAGVKPIWVGLALVLGIALGAVGFPLLKGLLSAHPAPTQSPGPPESSPPAAVSATPSPTLQATDFSGAWQIEQEDPQQETTSFVNGILEWKFQDGSLEGPLTTAHGLSFQLKFRVTNIDSAVRGAIALEAQNGEGQELGLGALSRQGTGIRLMLMTPGLGTRTLDLRALTPADREKFLSEQNWTYCKSNLKNLATALEMYSTDNGGRYPLGLEALPGGNYLKLIPSCPTQAVYSYEVTASPDRFTLNCKGSHPQAGYPQYSSDQGLLERP